MFKNPKFVTTPALKWIILFRPWILQGIKWQIHLKLSLPLAFSDVLLRGGGRIDNSRPIKPPMCPNSQVKAIKPRNPLPYAKPWQRRQLYSCRILLCRKAVLFSLNSYRNYLDICGYISYYFCFHFLWNCIWMLIPDWFSKTLEVFYNSHPQVA